MPICVLFGARTTDSSMSPFWPNGIPVTRVPDQAIASYRSYRRGNHFPLHVSNGCSNGCSNGARPGPTGLGACPSDQGARSRAKPLWADTLPAAHALFAPGSVMDASLPPSAHVAVWSLLLSLCLALPRSSARTPPAYLIYLPKPCLVILRLSSSFSSFHLLPVHRPSISNCLYSSGWGTNSLFCCFPRVSLHLVLRLCRR